MELTGVYLIVIACGIFLLPGHHCCSSLFGLAVVEKIRDVPTRIAEKTVKTCLPDEYKNVFTQTCTEYEEDSDYESSGDCPETMHLELIPDTKTVTCVCNTQSAEEVPLIYVHQKKQCYELFRKGPCRAGKVILIKNGTRPGCFDNPCPHMNYDVDNKLIVVFEGKCSRLEDDCIDEDGSDGKIRFLRESLICSTSRSEDHALPALGGECNVEQRFGYECLDIFEEDFD